MPGVLIIDDDEITISLMREILLEEGYQVFSTADGPQGLAICKRRKPDLVLLDLGLPSMSGLEVLRRLRAQDRSAKVIVITGLGTEESLQIARGYGITDFLLKPIEIDGFMKKVRKLLDGPVGRGLH